MPIKDKEYWKIYNQKRKAKGYFQQNYLQRKGVVKTSEVVKKENEMVVKSESLPPKEILPLNLQPASIVVNDILQPLPPCQICPNMNANYGTNKTYCLNCDLKTNQQEITPFGLVQQLQEKVKEQQETINRLKDKLREKDSENKSLIENITKLKKPIQNQTNFLSMPNLYALINKHKNYQTIQHLYSQQEIKEREFLKSLLDKLWSFAG